MKRSYRDVPVEEACSYKLPHSGIQGPLTATGEECPWPWEPMALHGAPVGMFHCNWCGMMVAAGVPHTDYGSPHDLQQVP